TLRASHRRRYGSHESAGRIVLDVQERCVQRTHAIHSASGGRLGGYPDGLPAAAGIRTAPDGWCSLIGEQGPEVAGDVVDLWADRLLERRLVRDGRVERGETPDG